MELMAARSNAGAITVRKPAQSSVEKAPVGMPSTRYSNSSTAACTSSRRGEEVSAPDFIIKTRYGRFPLKLEADRK